MKIDDIVKLGEIEFRIAQFLNPPIHGYDTVIQNIKEGCPYFANSAELTIVQKVYVSMDYNGKYLVTVSPTSIRNGSDVWEVDLSKCQKL